MQCYPITTRLHRAFSLVMCTANLQEWEVCSVSQTSLNMEPSVPWKIILETLVCWCLWRLGMDEIPGEIALSGKGRVLKMAVWRIKIRHVQRIWGEQTVLILILPYFELSQWKLCCCYGALEQRKSCPQIQNLLSNLICSTVPSPFIHYKISLNSETVPQT